MTRARIDVGAWTPKEVRIDDFHMDFGLFELQGRGRLVGGSVEYAVLDVSLKDDRVLERNYRDRIGEAGVLRLRLAGTTEAPYFLPEGRRSAPEPKSPQPADEEADTLGEGSSP